ncbi:MAG: FtsK/SpoIIIE domain-containing protein [Spirochaetes bacterium]|nr:FtsK/SpoIIIE domain-containing protein [Spirochaetota bacterium]
MAVAWITAAGAFGGLVRLQLTSLLGLSFWLIPLIFAYWAAVIFSRKDRNIPFTVFLASGLMWLWWAGLLHIFEAGGQVGALAGSLAVDSFGSFLAGVIFAGLILITSFFMFSITPAALAGRIAALLKTERFRRKPKPAKKAIAKTEAEPAATLPAATLPVAEERHETAALTSVFDPNWKMPELSILEKEEAAPDSGNIEQNTDIIKSTLADFKIDVEMEAVNVGPRVSQYALRPASGVKLAKISSLESNLALALGARSLRIEAPIPGQRAVGIEVPNAKAGEVRLHGILASQAWEEAGADKLTFAIGQDIAGEAVVANLAKMPHLLIAGQTGSGKSVMLNSLIVSLLYRNAPSEARLILVDPKQVEMAPYAGIPHLLSPIITEPEKTVLALKWAVDEMERRYALLAGKKLRDIKSYNENAGGKMPYIVIVIDELADLMMTAAKDVETLIVRLAQKARAVGIHLVLATQRPSVNVITGLIKANVPARIAFTVASQVDSRTILDQAGAEKLLGQGDMLFLTAEMDKPKRIQGAWVTDEETAQVAAHLRTQPPADNDGSNELLAKVLLHNVSTGF